MADKFRDMPTNKQDPTDDGFAITPTDAEVDLAIIPRTLNVAASGTVRVMTLGGTVLTLYVAAGIQFSQRVKRVYATGTTATGIVGLF